MNFTHHGLSYGKVYKGWQKLIKVELLFLTRKTVVIESVFSSKFLMELRIKGENRHVLKEKENRLNIIKASLLCRGLTLRLIYLSRNILLPIIINKNPRING